MSSSEEVARQLDALWQKYLPTMLSRLATIEAAIRAAEDGKPDEELKMKGAHEAHKLAGSLGTFGLHSSSAMSIKIEKILSEPIPLAGMTADLRNLFESVRRDIDRRSTMQDLEP